MALYQKVWGVQGRDVLEWLTTVGGGVPPPLFPPLDPTTVICGIIVALNSSEPCF